MLTDNRQYYIDWLRIIAIGLLLIYHTAICFQPWGFMLGFTIYDKPFEALWAPMTILNVWRIPLLFFISGMGVYYASQSRSCKQLLQERAKRILLPFIFGVFCIVPLQVLLAQYYYHQSLSYMFAPAHLWFLGNIFIYVLALLPALYYLKTNNGKKLAEVIKKIFTNPAGLVTVFAAFILQAWALNPALYQLYALTWHGFLLGLLAFLFGFCFMLSGNGFWRMLLRWQWVLLIVAVALCVYRLLQPQANVPGTQLSVESNCWVLTLFAFGYKHLNRPGITLRYLSQAAYPVYIVHMVFLYLASLLIFPLHLSAYTAFILVLLVTIAGCLITYEYVIKRTNVTRLLFGLKPMNKNKLYQKGNTAKTQPAGLQ